MSFGKFKKIIDNRVRLLGFANIFLIVVLLLFNSVLKPNAEYEHIHNFIAGFAVALEFIVCVNIFKLSIAIKDEGKLEELFIKETDERNKLIREKSLIGAFYSTVFALLIGIILHLFFILNALIVLIVIIFWAALAKIILARIYESRL